MDSHIYSMAPTKGQNWIGMLPNSHFPNHVQNNVRVSANGPRGTVNMANWITKVKRSTVSKRR